jgi:hypothetical protein
MKTRVTKGIEEGRGDGDGRERDMGKEKSDYKSVSGMRNGNN